MLEDAGRCCQMLGDVGRLRWIDARALRVSGNHPNDGGGVPRFD
eukprot:gene16884-biopygen12838